MTEKISPPPQGEIAHLRDGRDITQGYLSGLDILYPQDEILRQQGYRLEVYEKLLEDDQVASCLQQRISAVVSCEWIVEAGGDRRIDKQAAEFLRKQLEAINFDNATGKMLYGVFYGFGAGELIYRRDGDRALLKAIKVKRQRRFRFGIDGDLRLLTLKDPYKGEPLPPRKFWSFCTGADNDDDPYGKGLAHWLYWPVFFKKNGVKFWVKFLESLAKGRRLGKYARGTAKAEQDKLLAAAFALGEDCAAVIPDDATLELLEVASQTGDYDAFVVKMHEAIAKIILSQTMTTDSGSSLSQAEVHEGVKRAVVKMDGDLVCQSFNDGPARWLTEWNFPGAAIPKVWRQTEAKEDLKPVADRDRVLFDMGFIPTADYIRSTYGDGFALPQGDEQRGSLNGAQVQSLMEMLQLVGQGQLPVSVMGDLMLLAFPGLPAEQVLALQEKMQQAAEEAMAKEAGKAEAPPPSLEDISTSFAQGAFTESKVNRDAKGRFARKNDIESYKRSALREANEAIASDTSLDDLIEGFRGAISEMGDQLRESKSEDEKNRLRSKIQGHKLVERLLKKSSPPSDLALAKASKSYSTRQDRGKWLRKMRTEKQAEISSLLKANDEDGLSKARSEMAEIQRRTQRNMGLLPNEMLVNFKE